MKKLSCIVFIALVFLFLSCTKETTTSQLSSSVSTFEEDGLAKRKDPSLIGGQNLITLPTGDYTYPTSNALLWIPIPYEKEGYENRRFPLIISLDGVGENNTNINSLLHTGTIAKRIADGWNASAIDPITKKRFKFFVFTPQCPASWGWSAPHIKTMLAQLKNDYRIDTTRIYITGYSAGGWGMWSCITDDESLCNQFAAIGPVSSAGADHPDKITNVDKYGIACWNICGTTDAFYSLSVSYTNIINSGDPVIPAIRTGLDGIGHSAWYQAYDTSWRVDGKNLFEWMLQYRK